jgi:two-component system chemotaxis response regulator CheY
MNPDLLRARLLLIEDHGPTVETLRAILQAVGISRISHAGDAAQAMNMLEEQPFDMVLCDFNLGATNGLSLVRSIRKTGGIGNPNVPIVMITAHAETDRVAEAQAAGVDDFLVKPIEPDTLTHCLTKLFDRSRSFVKTRTYAGPDRRRRHAANTPDRRQEDRKSPSSVPQNKWIVPPKS